MSALRPLPHSDRLWSSRGWACRTPARLRQKPWQKQDVENVRLQAAPDSILRACERFMRMRTTWMDSWCFAAIS